MLCFFGCFWGCSTPGCFPWSCVTKLGLLCNSCVDSVECQGTPTPDAGKIVRYSFLTSYSVQVCNLCCFLCWKRKYGVRFPRVGSHLFFFLISSFGSNLSCADVYISPEQTSYFRSQFLQLFPVVPKFQHWYLILFLISSSNVAVSMQSNSNRHQKKNAILIVLTFVCFLHWNSMSYILLMDLDLLQRATRNQVHSILISYHVTLPHKLVKAGF